MIIGGQRVGVDRFRDLLVEVGTQIADHSGDALVVRTERRVGAGPDHLRTGVQVIEIDLLVPAF